MPSEVFGVSRRVGAEVLFQIVKFGKVVFYRYMHIYIYL